jgi:hypothetical protein
MKRLIFGLALLLCASPAWAKVTRVEVKARTEMALGYERIDATVHFVLDPANPRNGEIADLALADSRELAADLVLLRPRYGGNGVLHLEIPNRGGLGRSLDPTRDDFLFRRGYTIAWLGWQFDVRDEPSRLRLYPPVARGVRGLVRSDFIVDSKQAEHTIGHFIVGALGGKGYPVADRQDPANRLFERDDVTSERREIPRSAWRYTGDSTIAVDGGFLPGKIYEIVYPAADPAIVGAGFAAVRDFVSYLKHDPAAVAPVKHAFGFGISQSGRYLRHFVYQGFNADEEGRQVFDGLLVHVAGAGRGNFNHRFAQPSRDSGQIVPALYPVDVFPFADLPTVDPDSGRREGLLDRASKDGVVPRIFYLNTGYEYWGRGASLIHTTPDGKEDFEPAPTSRIYALAGHGHIGGPFPPQQPPGAQRLQGFLGYWPLTHALVDALEAWVKKGQEPPPSRYPRLLDGSLMAADTLPAPPAPDTRPTAYRPFRTDGAEPPKILGSYPTLVSRVDADGNELAGVRMPFLSVPLGNHRPWNLRSAAFGFPHHRASFIAAFLPFGKAQQAERYRSREEYLGRFTAETLALIEARYLVEEDLHELLQRAGELWDWVAAGE